ncbi:MAG: hypothetical protein PHF51_05625 [Candidatus ainarchaeum sp.]|nr:hypothetical protein [Candidatus ainarchaeum sp.]
MDGVHDFFKCEKCGKGLNCTAEQRPIVDRSGFTRVFCAECFRHVEK